MNPIKHFIKIDIKSQNRNKDFPIRHLHASRSEIEAISKGTAPEIYTHVYGTSRVPEEHKTAAREVLKDKWGKNKKKYNYRYTGSSVAYGPIYADTPIEAKKQIGKVKGLEVWETR